MKRTYIPLSISWNILRLFILILTVISIYGLIYGIQNNYNIFILLVVSLGIIFFLFSFIRLLFCFGIKLSENTLNAIGDGLPKFEKIQHKCNIELKNIIDINIISSHNDSKDNPIKLNYQSLSVPKKYLEFKLLDDKIERICINHYSKKQVISILNNILKKIPDNNKRDLSIDKIMNDWYSFGNYNIEKK